MPIKAAIKVFPCIPDHPAQTAPRGQYAVAAVSPKTFDDGLIALQLPNQAPYPNFPRCSREKNTAASAPHSSHDTEYGETLDDLMQMIAGKIAKRSRQRLNVERPPRGAWWRAASARAGQNLLRREVAWAHP